MEEFPLAEKDLKREGGKWILRTVIHSPEGAGRFVIGLAADVKILGIANILRRVGKLT